jgi:hypothetical protein
MQYALHATVRIDRLAGHTAVTWHGYRHTVASIASAPSAGVAAYLGGSALHVGKHNQGCSKPCLASLPHSAFHAWQTRVRGASSGHD